MKFASVIILLFLIINLSCKKAESSKDSSVIKAVSDQPLVKGHYGNSWIEINTSVLENNIDLLQKSLDGRTKICAIIKANAYGHGVDLVMQHLHG